VKLSIVVPAKNEAQSIRSCLQNLRRIVREEHGVPCEIIVVDDSSTDGTGDVVRAEMREDPTVRLITNTARSGFGRAVRLGLDHVTGDVVVICMADGSDAPRDVVRYLRKVEEGYECVFGSRFVPGARVVDYPRFRRVLNRLGNRLVQLVFWVPFNDVSNAFKAYRRHVIRECGPFSANDFELTLEMALRAVTRGYRIAQVPVAWSNRTAGRSKLRLLPMIPRYLGAIARARVAG
jgi:dolichol-phosphate mannosyltransferase